MNCNYIVKLISTTLQQYCLLFLALFVLFLTGCPAQIDTINKTDAHPANSNYSFVVWKHEIPEKLPAGMTITVPMTIINNGLKAWESTPDKPYFVSYHWKHPGGRFNAEMFWGLRSPLPEFVGSGELVNIEFQLNVPEVAKYYDLTIDIVQGTSFVREEVSWFEELGWKTYDLRLEAVAE